MSSDPNVRSADNGCNLILFSYVLLNIVRLSNSSKMLLFVVIMVSNIIFLFYWALKMYLEMRAMLVKKMGFIYLYICMCGNTQKYEFLKKEVLIEEENEILREDFLKSNYLN